MRKSVTILVIALLALLTACNQGKMLPPRAVDVNGIFSVAVPRNLVAQSDLHQFAPLQLADEPGGYFVVAIDESKESIQALKLHYSLADYADFTETTISDAFDTVRVTGRSTFENNGLQCQTVDFFAAVNGPEEPLEVYYHIAVFEGQDKFYQLICWTTQSQEEELLAAAKEMECSFHELGSEHGRQTASASHFGHAR